MWVTARLNASFDARHGTLALRSNQAQVYWFDADCDGRLDG
ncbi:MAG: hypothetical protein ACI8W7_002836 [Gammaproteobacteria bacterium]|jgi:hypothetical protein